MKKFFTVKIDKYEDGYRNFTVPAKTHRGALIEAAPYQADDFKFHCIGADGSKWYITPSGRVAVVTLN